MKLITQARIEQALGDTFTARATVYNVESHSGIVVLPGAFSDSLDTFVRDGHVLYQHDSSNLPVAYISAVEDTSDALVVTCRWYAHDYAAAVRDIVETRLAAGRGVDVSIGYYVADGDVEYSDGRTIVRRGELIEMSIVLWGDNPEAEVVTTQSKIEDDETTAEEMVKAAVYACAHLQRRLRAIRSLREKEARAVSKAWRERSRNLSQRVRRIADAIESLGRECELLANDDERNREARERLRELVSQLQQQP